MKKGAIIALILLVVLMLISLMLNALAVAGVFWLRGVALASVTGARTGLPDISEETFSYTLKVEQKIPIAASVPIDENIVVPVQTTVPISTIVTIPINAGLLGTFDIDVPIQTLVPVDLEFTVPISKTVAIATTVTLDVDVPIDIPLADTPLPGYLEGLDKALQKLEEELTNPFRDRKK